MYGYQEITRLSSVVLLFNTFMALFFHFPMKFFFKFCFECFFRMIPHLAACTEVPLSCSHPFFAFASLLVTPLYESFSYLFHHLWHEIHIIY